jgi:heme oxygenase
VTLSELLRERTVDVHRQAERSAFVSRIVNGTLGRAAHAAHLLALHPVYYTLEAALDGRRTDPRLGPFHLPALWRRAALAADLEFLLGPDWERGAAVPGSGAYVERLQGIGRQQPIALVSHAYVRYLGDLSGGQMLKAMIARQLGLDGNGLRFYEFPEITDPKAFKADFRARLDELPLADGEAEALVEEARTAFLLNAAIFDQLEAAAA